MTVSTTPKKPLSLHAIELLCVGWVQLLLFVCCLYGGTTLLSYTVGTSRLHAGGPIPKLFFVMLRLPSANNALANVDLSEVPSYRHAHPDASLHMSVRHGKSSYAEFTVLAEEKDTQIIAAETGEDELFYVKYRVSGNTITPLYFRSDGLCMMFPAFAYSLLLIVFIQLVAPRLQRRWMMRLMSDQKTGKIIR